MIINLFTRTFLCTPDFLQVDRSKYPSFNFVDTKYIYKDFYEKKFKGTKFHSMDYPYQIEYFYRYMKKRDYLKNYSYNFIVCRGYKEFYKIIIRYIQSIFYIDDINKNRIYDLYKIFTSYTNHYNRWKYIIEKEVFNIESKNEVINFKTLFISMLKYRHPKYISSIYIDKEPWCDIIPAEYFALYQDMAYKKYEMFWIYDFIEQMRSYEYKLFNEGKELPKWIKDIHEEYEKSNQYSELAYYIRSHRDEIINKALGSEDKNYFSTLFIHDPWVYCHLDWFKFGYSDLNMFKFNKELRNTLVYLKDGHNLVRRENNNGKYYAICNF